MMSTLPYLCLNLYLYLNPIILIFIVLKSLLLHNQKTETYILNQIYISVSEYLVNIHKIISRKTFTTYFKISEKSNVAK